MKLKATLFALIILLTQPVLAQFDSADFNSKKNLKITRITPKGNDVPSARQIVINFNRPVVPIGKMERSKEEIPIEITPKVNCQWRWLNTSSLACQLDNKNKLKKATKYNLKVNPGIKAEDGETISKAYEHEFITERPKVRYTWFKNWKSPGTPVVRITFNQSVAKSSVAKAFAFTYHKAGADKAYITHDILVKKDPDDRQKPRYVVVPGENYILDFNVFGSDKSDDEPSEENGEEARRIWLVSPNEELPLDSKINLKVKPGLISVLGSEKGIEDRTVVNFNTFPEFEFLGVNCTTNSGARIFVTKENSNTAGKCNPLKGVGVAFSSPVLKSQIKKNFTLTPDLAGGRTDYDPWANQRDYTGLRTSHRKGAKYTIWLPENLRADKTYNLKTKQPELNVADKVKSVFSDIRPSDLEDEFSRKLKEPIDLTFYTDNRLPDFHIIHKTSVLEKQIDSELPIYVTNLEKVDFNYRSLTKSGNKDKASSTINDIANVKNTSFSVPVEVRKMLDDKSGAVYGKVTTTPVVNKNTNQHLFFSIVTPYQLHVKMGHYNTAIWVTDLATGKPVPNAKVRIYKDKVKDLSSDFDTLDEAKTDSSGIAILKGTSELNPQLDLFKWCYYSKQDECDRLFVRVDKGKEMAIMPLENRFEVNTYRASNYTVYKSNKKKYGHIHAWGTTAQGVYRAGGTMQYKFYVRNQDNDAYIMPPKKDYKLEIVDPTGKTAHEIKNITLSDFGSYSGEYTIPKNAAVGWYKFKLSSNFTKDYTWSPMRVLVSEFTPSPFKVENNLNGDLFKPNGKVEVATYSKLHSGGAYTDAETRITAILRKSYFSSKHPIAKGFYFNSSGGVNKKEIFKKIDNVGDKGQVTHDFKMPDDTKIVYGKLTVESAVRDDRGKYIAASSSANFVGLDRFVGLKSTKWTYDEDKPAEVKYIVVDERGNPVEGVDVSLKVHHLQTKAAKVKGAGNAYLTNFVEQWIDVADCQDASSLEPKECIFTPQKPGRYKITANIKDTKGRTHSTQTSVWVVGKGRVVWREADDHSLQIIPEKAEYNIGDKARYLVKNPYPGANALITIERYGVLKSWVQKLEGSTPVIEFAVEPDFMPGFYLSAVVVSPRVQTPPPAMGQIDLGKPAFKMGYVKVPVKAPYKQIDVKIETDSDVYKPRDMVKADINVQLKNKDKNENIEIAVAVLDEAVLDLIKGGKKYFDPYEGFYKLDSLDLSNYNLITRLIGRQKFEKKGANPGGDGGADISMRSLFKFVSYWNPSVKPDKNGNASVSFEVPDNLTGWRILAFAVTPTDRMGLGYSNFKVNRPTEIRPVMPNQVTEGDQFQAGFSVMNRTDEPREIAVEIESRGNIKPFKADMMQGHFECKPEDKSFVCRYITSVSLKPYKRTTVFMPIHTKPLPADRNAKQGVVSFIAKASDEIDGDGIEHFVPIHKRRSLETAANYGTTTKDNVSESLQFPEKIHTDVGSVSVTLSPSVLGSVEGAFGYIRDYPYSCWEQKLTKGVMASHFVNLKQYMPDDFKWEKSKTLPDDILSQAVNYQAPNGGMVYYVPRDIYVSPYLSAYTALAFNWLKDSKYAIPQNVETKLHGYLQNLLKKNSLPTFYSRGMSSTVRAVALAALAPHGKVSLSDLDRYFPHVEYMSLFGKAHYLQAALSVKGGDKIAMKVADMILAHSIQSGGKYSFNEELDDSYARILATPLRANCGILSSLLKYDSSMRADSSISQIPFKLVRTITQTRGNREHWENTQENIFCLNSLIDYSRIYENVKPNMSITASLDKEKIGKAKFKDLRDDMVTLERPINATDVGAKRKVNISRKGDGRLYYATRMSYATLDENANRINSGIDLRKEYSVERDDKWVLLKNPNEIKRGELVRVDIYVSLPTARNFVVVDDPVPGGLEPVNRNLANTSIVDADKGKFQASGGSWWFQFDDWHHYNVSRWSFYHKELRHNSARFYSDYLPAGNYHLSYTAQAVAEGKFTKMPVHAEEMYDPDIFGKGLPGTLKVGK